MNTYTEIIATLESEAQRRDIQSTLAQEPIIADDYRRIAAHLRAAADIVREASVS